MTYFVTSSITVFETAIIWVRCVNDKMVNENPRKIKDGNKRNFCLNFQLKCGLRVKFAVYEGEMMKEGALPDLRYMTHIAVLRLTHSN